MKAYQFSVVRYRESKSGGELVNIGLVMFVPKDRTVFHFVSTKYGRLSKFFGEFDGKGYQRLVSELERRFKSILEDDEKSKQLHLGEYVRTMTSEGLSLAGFQESLGNNPESCFQWSPMMGGMHPNPEKRFAELKYEFVTRHEGKKTRERKDEDAIQKQVVEFLHPLSFSSQLEYGREIMGKFDASHTFAVSWKNGMVQVLDPVSFDYLSASEIERKANEWCGTLHNLSGGVDFRFTAVTAPPPEQGLFKAYDHACQLIGDMKQTREIIQFSEFSKLEEMIADDLRAA